MVEEVVVDVVVEVVVVEEVVDDVVVEGIEAVKEVDMEVVEVDRLLPGAAEDVVKDVEVSGLLQVITNNYKSFSFQELFLHANKVYSCHIPTKN